MPRVSESMSTKCGDPPRCEIALAVATKLRGGIITSLLALTPARNNDNLKATVPLETAIACLEPV